MWTKLSYFYPRSPRGERRCVLLGLPHPLQISIHAPREGSDIMLFARFRKPEHFYPRSPRGERRWQMIRSAWTKQNFYPRSPRGERPTQRLEPCISGLISIHAPREGSDSDALGGDATMTLFLSTLPARGATLCHRSAGRSQRISIHAPREGSDLKAIAGMMGDLSFLSTLPARGATLADADRTQAQFISIHAPREGSD